MYVSRQQKNKIGHRLSLLITQTKFLPEIAPKRWAAADGIRIQLHIQELHNVEVYNVYSELGGGGGSFFGGGREPWKPGNSSKITYLRHKNRACRRSVQEETSCI